MRAIHFILPLVMLACSTLASCTAASYEEALQWHLYNEAMKKDLERQGFPQYSPPL